MSREPISRRKALGLATAGAGAVVVGAAGWAAGVGAAGARLLQPGTAAQQLAEPEVLAARNSVLDVALTAAPGARLAGRETAALGYNNTSPGPTLRVAPGDLLRIRLVNNLDQPTNLHTHGLHVSPEGNGDNPFVTVRPGESHDYAYRIPDTHPAGTFWYHPHHHGYVADQIFGGLAGALLVDGGPDLPVGRQRVLLITDTTLDGAGGLVPAGPMDRMMGREGELVLVNGQYRPAVTATPGASERWRIINGCVSRVLSLRLEGHRMTQVATDGYFLPAPVERARVVLSPGHRGDVVIHPVAGEHRLITDPYQRGAPMGGMADRGGMGPPTTSRGPITLATLNVSGPAQREVRLPATLPAPPAAPGPVARRRDLTFATGMGMMTGGMAFTINGRTFDPHRVDQTARLGSTEEWVVSNISPMEHSLHLHVWPFQLIEDSTGRPPLSRRQDVVVLPANGWARLRIHFADFPGRSVYHCHTLDHEDAGMMATIQVNR